MFRVRANGNSIKRNLSFIFLHNDVFFILSVVLLTCFLRVIFVPRIDIAMHISVLLLTCSYYSLHILLLFSSCVVALCELVPLLSSLVIVVLLACSYFSLRM